MMQNEGFRRRGVVEKDPRHECNTNRFIPDPSIVRLTGRNDEVQLLAELIFDIHNTEYRWPSALLQADHRIARRVPVL